MIDHLTWLHISDFHFTAEGDRFSQTVACDALLDDVDARTAEHGPISFVLVTGDIAFSGQPAEYSRAADFMKSLADRLSVEPARFFFVPGNHDVDRSAHEFALAGAIRILSSQHEVDRALGNPARIADLVDRQTAYRDFVAGFAPDQERAPTPDGLGYVAALQIEPLTVAIIGLNSAWLCGADGEATSLVIGERQLLGAFELVRQVDPHLVIALAHHPIECLTDWDQQSCRTRLLANAHFLHRGHMHEPDVTTSPHRKCVIVAAGSAHAGRFYPNSYNIVRLDLGAGISTVHPYTYRQDSRVFEPSSPITAPCVLGGEIPGTSQDLVEAITTATPSVARFAPYMTALVLGQKDEIPLQIAGSVDFVPSGVAQESDPGQAGPAIAFLGLRNLLRLHDPDLPLVDRIRDHSAAVEEFGSRLRECADLDDACRARITNASLISPGGALPLDTWMPQTAALLEDLRARQEWQLLEAQARRSLGSEDPGLARLAKRTLAEALMHSDEAQDRCEALALAEELIAEPDAIVDDCLIACGASEVQGAPERSIQLVIEALSRWPESDALVSYGRDLVTRTGDASLRSAVEAAREDHQPMSETEGFQVGIEFDSVLAAISKQIYETPLAFIRENVQNAVDALRMQASRQGIPSSDPSLNVHVTAEGNICTITEQRDRHVTGRPPKTLLDDRRQRQENQDPAWHTYTRRQPGPRRPLRPLRQEYGQAQPAQPSGAARPMGPLPGQRTPPTI